MKTEMAMAPIRSFMASNPRSMKGFTLVELMVAMLIGTIILAAVAQVFATSKGTHQTEEGMARVQENGRFALEFLAQDIRMAGYAGCNSNLPATKINSIAQPAGDPTQFTPEGMRAFRYAGTAPANNLADWDPDLPADYFSNGDVLPNTDVLIIERATTLSTKLTGNMTAANANIQIVNTAAIAGQIIPGDILMLSDCSNADIFRANGVSSGAGIKTITHTAGNSTNFLSKAYQGDADLMKLVSRAYFIGPGASGEPSLIRRELGNAGVLVDQELVEGIETMMFLYGVDTDATADKTANNYRRPVDVTDWSRVVSVRVGVLAHSLTNADTELDQRTYNLLNDTETGTEAAFDDYDPVDDRRRRKVFSTTVRVRNH